MAKAKLLPVLFLVVLPAIAQGPPPGTGLPKDVQEFLNVPIWYLTYRVSVVCRDGGVGRGGGSWSFSSERVISGSVQLGIRSQGPSLSLADGPLQGEAFIKRIDKYTTWLGGTMPDESKTSDEQFAALMRVMEANQKAFERYRYHQESEHPGANAESSEPAGMERSRATAAGDAPVTCLVQFHLEIDGANKKFKLTYAPHFVDTQQSRTAVRGESVIRIGQPFESHQPIEDPMHVAATDQVASGGPPSGIIEGNLPGSLGNLSGSPSYAVRLGTADGYKGTMMIQFTLSPKPPEPAELFIIPPADYEAWRPLAGKNEKFSGDWVPVQVKLQKKGGGPPQFKAQRFIYRLKDTSKERGVCMNWPPQPEANSPFDLQFEQDANGRDVLIVGTDGQAAEQAGTSPTTDGEIVVSCFDYGAWGELEALAELENGEVVYGVVKGSNEPRLRLPARKKDSKIANVFLKGLANLKDDDDSEDDPVGDIFKGDGLTLYEEYRGFMDGDHWTAGDPKKKDVFVLNQLRSHPPAMRGIKVFAKATGLNVHSLLKDNQVNAAMMINFHCTACPHVVDQHVIRIRAGPTDTTTAFVEEVGTPGTAKSVNVSLAWEEFWQVGRRSIPSFERTIAHEMSHDCNVYHHGEADKDVTWEYVAGPPAYINERGFGRITVKSEDGTTLTASNLFPNPASNSVLEDLRLGVQHGQHSGHADCLMRYWVAWAYPSLTDPSVRYLSPGEIRGTILCNTTAGTGINDAGHRPQSRYSTAATPANGGTWVKANRGDCKHQLRVNDKGQEPER